MGSQTNPRTKILKILAAGAFIGVLVTLVSAGTYHAAGSPSFCLSCHSMTDVGVSWKGSTHKQFGCTECHLPDGNIVVQAMYKAKAGMRDLYHETLRTYPAFIGISDEGRSIAEGNCLRCHFSTVENTFMAARGESCLKCHHGLVHGTGNTTGGIRVE
ncbi:MAG TPA: NapC/NirT family cytochrome c [Deltaproteobacteria bacterium]|nr:NapC/NirT family cytochrome c [Deltaproteobacteria bacterium]HOI06014.1 NapC/NirT family cytochrome c [Deltaproteobacteria bacterium]